MEDDRAFRVVQSGPYTGQRVYMTGDRKRIDSVASRAEAVLVAHQRHGIEGCLCGWAELGKSHPAHQVAMLREAGLLK